MHSTIRAAMEEEVASAMDGLKDHQRKMRAAREEALKLTVAKLSKDRSLTVTVGGQGELRNIQFHGTDYRTMPPAEVAAILVETINAARQEMVTKASAAFGEVSKLGSKLRESLIGGSDFEETLATLRQAVLEPASPSDEEE
jgi:DNA-binding protein YbaB